MAEYVADKLDAARHSITGSNVSKIVCKASSREIFGPKKKHLDYLITCTESDNISVPSLAELLFERSSMSSWVIVSKSLVTFHNLMSAGNERFLQYLASRTTLWNLENFLDKSGVRGYDMSTFIRRYSNYLTKKAHTYTEAGLDFCRVSRGPNGLIRKMDTPKILKALPQIQQQVDSLLEVDIQSIELGNGVINSAFVMLFKDLVKLFACYNDGMINLLEMFFEMNKKSCKEALEIYKKFLARMDSVKEFLKVAEDYRLTELIMLHGARSKDVGINPSDIPDLTKAPSSLMEALESHYQSLEKGKVPVASSKRPNLKPITVPQITTESLNNPIKFDDYKKKELIKEEEERLNAFKEIKKTQEPLRMAAPTRQTPSSRQDAWSTAFEGNAAANNVQNANNNNDLLELHQVFSAPKPVETFTPNFGQSDPFPPSGGQPVNTGGFGSSQPSPWSPGPNQTAQVGGNLFGGDLLTGGPSGILQPMNKPQTEVQQTQISVNKGDLDTSLNKVVQSIDNLNAAGIRPAPGTTGRGHQWTPAKPTVKTGGANFQMGSTVGPTLSPTMAPAGMQTQPLVRPPYVQPGIYPQPMVYGQTPMMQQPAMQANLFPQQRVPVNDPFGAPVPGNQALF